MTTLDSQTFANNYNNGVYKAQAVVNAIPFSSYTAANPSNYMLGIYGGFQCVMTPARGFESIIFNLNVTNIV